MQITAIETSVLDSPVGEVSFPAGRGEFVATVRTVFVRIHTDSDITGIGETMVSDPTGKMVQSVAEGVNALAKHILGEDPADVVRLWELLNTHVKRQGSYHSLSAIDQALWDIKGKVAGLPLYELFGGRTNEIQAYATFAYHKEVDELIEAAHWFAEKGFPVMKIAGRGSADEIREKIAQIAENIPNELRLALDTNTSLDFPEALAVGKTASEYELAWFEEPISHTDFDGQAELNRRTLVPISGYQNHKPHYTAVEQLRRNSLEIYQPALYRTGGITPSMRVATLTEAFNKRFLPHAPGAAIQFTASLHIATACPVSSMIEFSIFSEDIDDPGRYIASPYVDNLEDLYVEDGGIISPPDGPGLGLRIDEDTFEEYRIESHSINDV